ncbi:VOC family protein [Streptomyces sp. SID13031]|uniref:VOC family protein n=1 Tax=Streptomyces sp. SID13031 TaxID=2706046 RepID=UPI0013C9CAD9|nr:VOC family protein [Streptomyces sp. SID13031]NEA36641.1 hypothetical protein [Streptomyces sp. SID13031]
MWASSSSSSPASSPRRTPKRNNRGFCRFSVPWCCHGKPQMQLHLDLEVDDLDQAVAHAIDCGAELPAFQPQERVRVMLDPDGHPFCLYLE